MAKTNILVLTKTSSEDEDERRLQDVFIKTNVCWPALFCKASQISQKHLRWISIFVNCRALSRGGSRAAITSKVELFVIIVNGFQLLTMIPKSSTLDVAAVLDSPMP